MLADKILGRGDTIDEGEGAFRAAHGWSPGAPAAYSGDITHRPSTADHNDNETEGDQADGDKEGGNWAVCPGAPLGDITGGRGSLDLACHL